MPILENIRGKKVILASKSPRRHLLLGELGIEYEIVENHEVKEEYPDNLKPEDIPVYLAKKKAAEFSGILNKESILITADTIVWCEGHVINKPVDKEDAWRILDRLSGNMHTVITGVCITSLDKEVSFFATTDVYFSTLTKEEIDHYLKEYRPYDKAGAYGIQEWIGYIGIEKIDGSYFNVMGLPIQKLYRELKNF